MLQVRQIESLDLPELQPYRTMRRQMEHRQAGIFVAEGEKVVRRLLESRFEVVSVLLPEKWFHELKALLKQRPEEIRVYIAEKSLLETLTGFSMYQGLLAVGRVPPQPTLEMILARSPEPHLLVAVDGLSSAENVGALVRNCAAFNVQALITGETSTSPFLRRAVRSSMGTIFHLPVIESDNLVATISYLRSLNLLCIAAHPHVTGKTLAQLDLKGSCCLVFGSEGYGLAPATLAACNEAVAIPMPQKVDSLNVSSAAAVFLYEAARQRALASCL
jgi:tRNA G18 (ribose-2'-O)-methylase SpoU